MEKSSSLRSQSFSCSSCWQMGQSATSWLGSCRTRKRTRCEVRLRRGEKRPVSFAAGKIIISNSSQETWKRRWPPPPSPRVFLRFKSLFAQLMSFPSPFAPRLLRKDKGTQAFSQSLLTHTLRGLTKHIERLFSLSRARPPLSSPFLIRKFVPFCPAKLLKINAENAACHAKQLRINSPFVRAHFSPCCAEWVSKSEGVALSTRGAPSYLFLFFLRRQKRRRSKCIDGGTFKRHECRLGCLKSTHSSRALFGALFSLTTRHSGGKSKKSIP